MKYFSLLFVLLFHVHYENENFNDKKDMITDKINQKQSDFKRIIYLFKIPLHFFH